VSKPRTFSPEFKAQVVLQLLSGTKSSAELCREHQLSAQLLANWKDAFLARSASAFETNVHQSQEQARIAELERMVGRLAMENEILKKASLLLPTKSRNGK
jgi:transposase